MGSYERVIEERTCCIVHVISEGANQGEPSENKV